MSDAATTFNAGDKVQWQSACGHRTGTVVSLTEKRVRILMDGLRYATYSNVAIKNVRPA